MYLGVVGIERESAIVEAEIVFPRRGGAAPRAVELVHHTDMHEIRDGVRVFGRLIETAILGIAAARRSARQSDQRKRLRRPIRVIFGHAVRDQRVLAAKNDGSVGLGAETGEGLVEWVAAHAGF